jgi:hypothetical protein
MVAKRSITLAKPLKLSLSLSQASKPGTLPRRMSPRLLNMNPDASHGSS